MVNKTLSYENNTAAEDSEWRKRALVGAEEEIAFDEATEELEKGGNLSKTLRDSKWFPPMMVQMIAVGEQSGSLEKMLSKVADSYEKEVEAKMKGLTSLIEPFMILVMGVTMLFIVLSILLPIFEMNQLIR